MSLPPGDDAHNERLEAWRAVTWNTTTANLDAYMALLVRDRLSGVMNVSGWEINLENVAEKRALIAERETT